MDSYIKKHDPLSLSFSLMSRHKNTFELLFGYKANLHSKFYLVLDMSTTLVN